MTTHVIWQTTLQQVNDKLKQRRKVAESSREKMLFLGSLGMGFGDLKATAANKLPVTEEPKEENLLVKAASNCCSRVLNRCCCMCFIQSCYYMNDKCAILLAQICTALACFECINCCYELCA